MNFLLALALSVSTFRAAPLKVEAEPVLTPKYQTNGRRDPFVPLIVEEKGKPAAKAQKPVIAFQTVSPRLEGIIWSPGGRCFAVLDDRVVAEGDGVGPCRVARIERDRVTVTYEGKPFVLRLHDDLKEGRP